MENYHDADSRVFGQVNFPASPFFEDRELCERRWEINASSMGFAADNKTRAGGLKQSFPSYDLNQLLLWSLTILGTTTVRVEITIKQLTQRATGIHFCIEQQCEHTSVA